MSYMTQGLDNWLGFTWPGYMGREEWNDNFIFYRKEQGIDWTERPGSVGQL